MTDTPRTDLESFASSQPIDQRLASMERLARELEEELVEVSKDFRCLAELLDGHDATECRANLARLKESLASWQRLATSAEILRKRAEHALDSERALADRLAEQIEYIAKQELASEMDDHSGEHADWQEGYETCVKWSREALAAWKAARDEAHH